MRDVREENDNVVGDGGYSRDPIGGRLSSAHHVFDYMPHPALSTNQFNQIPMFDLNSDIIYPLVSPSMASQLVTYVMMS